MEIRHADLQIEVEEAQDAPAHPVGRPSALGLLLQRRRALEVLRSVHVHEPSDGLI